MEEERPVVSLFNVNNLDGFDESTQQFLRDAVKRPKIIDDSYTRDEDVRASIEEWKKMKDGK